MKRIPFVPTIIVALAIAAMVALGLWQLLERRPQKEAFLAQLAANPTLPPVTFPRFSDESLLFRRSSVYCLEPVSITRAGAGAAGYRVIASCRTGAEGPGVSIQLGTTRDPVGKVTWGGGQVGGWIAHAPDGRPLIAEVTERAAPRALMLVVDRPVAGLAPNAPPSIESIPNNHLAYAVQWFLFAVVAAIIYIVALRRRGRDALPSQGEGKPNN